MMALSMSRATTAAAVAARPALSIFYKPPILHSSRNITVSAASEDAAPSFPFARPHDTEPPKEYAELRSKCPVAPAKLFDGSNIWLITKHKDLKQVLTDDRFSKVRTAKGFPELNAGGRAAAASGTTPTFVDMDPPEHTKYRGMVEHWFTEEASERLRPSIQAKVDELIDGLINGPKPVDLAENFSMPLAFKVIYELLGIPFTDYHFLSTNVAVRSSGSSTAKDAGMAAQDLQKYMEKLVASKEKNPSNDLISELVQKQLKPGNMTRDELIQTAFLLLVAGNATVASMINLGVLTLLQHPDQLEAMKKDPSLVPGAVDELCRYHTASSYALRRLAKEDVKVGNQVIKAGEGIIALNQSANRDEEVFNNPNKFDIRRKPNPEVAFGYGTHLCVAMPLARVELQCALGGLFKRLPNLNIAIPMDQVAYSDPKKDVGVANLPVTW